MIVPRMLQALCLLIVLLSAMASLPAYAAEASPAALRAIREKGARAAALCREGKIEEALTLFTPEDIPRDGVLLRHKAAAGWNVASGCLEGGHIDAARQIYEAMVPLGEDAATRLHRAETAKILVRAYLDARDPGPARTVFAGMRALCRQGSARSGAAFLENQIRAQRTGAAQLLFAFFLQSGHLPDAATVFRDLPAAGTGGATLTEQAVMGRKLVAAYCAAGDIPSARAVYREMLDIQSNQPAVRNARNAAASAIGKSVASPWEISVKERVDAKLRGADVPSSIPRTMRNSRPANPVPASALTEAARLDVEKELLAIGEQTAKLCAEGNHQVAAALFQNGAQAGHGAGGSFPAFRARTGRTAVQRCIAAGRVSGVRTLLSAMENLGDTPEVRLERALAGEALARAYATAGDIGNLSVMYRSMFRLKAADPPGTPPDESGLEAGIRESIAHVAWMEFNARLYEGNQAAARNLYEDADAIGGAEGRGIRAEMAGALIRIYCREGRATAAETLFNDLSRFADGSDAFITARVMAALAIGRLRCGEAGDALSPPVARDASPYERALTQSHTAMGQAGMGFRRAAVATLSRMASPGSSLEVRDLTARTARDLAALCIEKGDPRNAVAAYERTTGLGTDGEVSETRGEFARTLIDSLCRNNDIGLARRVYDTMAAPPDPHDPIRSYRVPGALRLVLAYAANGDTVSARELFADFVPDGVPDDERKAAAEASFGAILRNAPIRNAELTYTALAVFDDDPAVRSLRLTAGMRAWALTLEQRDFRKALFFHNAVAALDPDNTLRDSRAAVSYALVKALCGQKAYGTGDMPDEVNLQGAERVYAAMGQLGDTKPVRAALALAACELSIGHARAADGVRLRRDLAGKARYYYQKIPVSGDVSGQLTDRKKTAEALLAKLHRE